MRKGAVPKKLTAFFVLVCFLSGELLRPSGVMAAPFAMPEVLVPTSFKIDLPADLGKVETLISNGSPNAIIQIQEAHGDLESQKKIEGILHYLKDTYGVDLLLLEGDASKLHPEYLNYFPGRADLNRKVLEALAPKGMASGPVFFLQDEPTVEAWGVEKTDSYRRNGTVFVEVLQRREKTEKFVGALNLQIERLTAPYLNKKLRHYLKRVDAFENGLVPFDGWLREQKDFARAILKQDLASPALQLEWPMFVRLFVLKEFEANLNMTNFARERGEFLKAIGGLPQELHNEIKRYLETPLSQSQLPDPETGILFENMVAGLPANFSYQAYPNITFYVGHLILQSELKGDRLFDELALLTDRIADRLAETPREKEIVGLLKKHRLLKRLFNLELSPKDYETIKSNERPATSGELRPSAFIKQFEKLNSDKLVRDYEFKHLAEIDALYARALDFYQGAEERDGDMLENIETRLKASGKNKAAVVTGGFHAEPFKNYFRGKGYNYALITPTMTESVMKARESYVQSVLQNYIAPLDPAKSEHRVTDFAITHPHGLQKLGVDAKPFTSALSMALSEMRNTSQLDTSPTAGVGAELKTAAKKNRSEVRINEKMSASLAQINQSPWVDSINLFLKPGIAEDIEDFNLDNPYGAAGAIAHYLDYQWNRLTSRRSKKFKEEQDILLARHAEELNRLFIGYLFSSPTEKSIFWATLGTWEEPRGGQRLKLEAGSMDKFFKSRQKSTKLFLEIAAGDDQEFAQALDLALHSYIRKSGMNQDSGVHKFFYRLDRLGNLADLNAPTKVLESTASFIVNSLSGELPPAAMAKFHHAALEGLPESEYQSLLGLEVPYRSWARQVIDAGRGANFMVQLQAKPFGDLPSVEKFRLLLPFLDPAQQTALAKGLFDRLNSGKLEASDVTFISQNYDELLVLLPRRVGVVTQPGVAFDLYHRIAETFKQSAFEYRNTYDTSLDQGEKKLGAHSREVAKEHLKGFFISNPSPELLKQALRYWNQQLSPGAPQRKRKSSLAEGQKIKLISDLELNTLSWVIKNVPKGGRNRDARRQLHDFILALVERRIQREDDPVAQWMSAIVVRMNTGLNDRQRIAETVLSFLEFAAFYTYLPRYVQKNKNKELKNLVAHFIRDAQGAKLVLEAEHYQVLKRKIIELILSAIFEKPVGLTPEEIGQLKKSVKDHEAAWFNDNLLLLLARYHGFQNEAGQKSVERYMLKLSESTVENNRFKNIPRYQWADPAIRTWFGEPLISLIQQGHQKALSILSGDPQGLQERYRDVLDDLLTHLELKQIAEDGREETLRQRFLHAGRADDFDPFWAIFTALIAKMEQSQEIAVETIEGWKKELKESAPKVFPYWSEVLIDFGHLEIAQRVGAKAELKAEFVITEDAAEFIHSGERPCYTCQRITEPTGFNQEGRPINRARQGQFFLAQIQVDQSVEARVVLEIAREKEEDKKVLLVERVYTSGSISSATLQREILNWAKETQQLDYVAFSSRANLPEEASTSIALELLPSDGLVYRDTAWLAHVTAVDISKYHTDAEIALSPARQLGLGFAPIRSEVRIPLRDTTRESLRSAARAEVPSGPIGQMTRESHPVAATAQAPSLQVPGPDLSSTSAARAEVRTRQDHALAAMRQALSEREPDIENVPQISVRLVRAKKSKPITQYLSIDGFGDWKNFDNYLSTVRTLLHSSDNDTWAAFFTSRVGVRIRKVLAKLGVREVVIDQIQPDLWNDYDYSMAVSGAIQREGIFYRPVLDVETARGADKAFAFLLKFIQNLPTTTRLRDALLSEGVLYDASTNLPVLGDPQVPSYFTFLEVIRGTKLISDAAIDALETSSYPYASELKAMMTGAGMEAAIASLWKSLPEEAGFGIGVISAWDSDDIERRINSNMWPQVAWPNGIQKEAMTRFKKPGGLRLVYAAYSGHRNPLLEIDVSSLFSRQIAEALAGWQAPSTAEVMRIQGKTQGLDRLISKLLRSAAELGFLEFRDRDVRFIAATPIVPAITEPRSEVRQPGQKSLDLTRREFGPAALAAAMGVTAFARALFGQEPKTAEAKKIAPVKTPEERRDAKADQILKIAAKKNNNITDGEFSGSEVFTWKDAYDDDTLQTMQDSQLERHFRWRRMVIDIAHDIVENGFQTVKEGEAPKPPKKLSQQAVGELALFFQKVKPANILSASASGTPEFSARDLRKLSLFTDKQFFLHQYARAVIKIKLGMDNKDFFGDLLTPEVLKTPLNQYVPPGAPAGVKADSPEGEKLRKELVYHIAAVMFDMESDETARRDNARTPENESTAGAIPRFTPGDAAWPVENLWKNSNTTVREVIEFMAQKKAGQNVARLEIEAFMLALFPSLPDGRQKELLRKQIEKKLIGRQKELGKVQDMVADLVKKPLKWDELSYVEAQMKALQTEFNGLQNKSGGMTSKQYEDFESKLKNKNLEFYAALIRDLAKSNKEIGEDYFEAVTRQLEMQLGYQRHLVHFVADKLDFLEEETKPLETLLLRRRDLRQAVASDKDIPPASKKRFEKLVKKIYDSNPKRFPFLRSEVRIPLRDTTRESHPVAATAQAPSLQVPGPDLSSASASRADVREGAVRAEQRLSVNRSAAAMVILARVFMGGIMLLGSSPELIAQVMPSRVVAAETPTMSLPAQIQQAVDALIAKQGIVDTSRPIIDHRFLEKKMDEVVLEDVVTTLAILIRMPGLKYYMPVTGQEAAFNDFKARLEAAVRAKFHVELAQIPNFTLKGVLFEDRLKSAINQYLNLLGRVDTAGILSGDDRLVTEAGFVTTGKPLRIKIDEEMFRPAAILAAAWDLSKKSLLALDRFERASSYVGNRLASLMADLAALKAVIRAA